MSRHGREVRKAEEGKGPHKNKYENRIGQKLNPSRRQEKAQSEGRRRQLELTAQSATNKPYTETPPQFTSNYYLTDIDLTDSTCKVRACCPEKAVLVSCDCYYGNPRSIRMTNFNTKKRVYSFDYDLWNSSEFRGSNGQGARELEAIEATVKEFTPTPQRRGSDENRRTNSLEYNW